MTTLARDIVTTPLVEYPPTAAQRVFRTVLEAMARPGSIHRIVDAEALGGRPAAAAPLLSLADLMTTVAPLTEADSELTADLGRVTGAPIGPVERARLVLSTVVDGERMRRLATGTPRAPHHGALLSQRVGALDGSGVKLRLHGPGVDGERDLIVDGLDDSFLDARDELVADFPTGVDVLLVADDGQLAALPRTTRAEVR